VILAQARIGLPKRDPFFMLNYSISPKRDSVAQARVRAVFIL